MSDEMKKQADDLHGIYVVALANLSDWNQAVPDIQQTEVWLRMVKDSLHQSPSVVSGMTDEVLLDYFEKAKHDAKILGAIPRPSSSLSSAIPTSGSVIPSEYMKFVREAGAAFPNDPDVRDWVANIVVVESELRKQQNRSDLVRRRLSQLGTDLEKLYKHALNASLATQAGTQTPIEAAEIQNRLLDQFKGKLINHCRKGKGATYQRISDNLAANSALTKQVVTDGQTVYDDLGDKLTKIRKKIKPLPQETVMDLLHQLEDHIINITNALDPNLLGIIFS